MEAFEVVGKQNISSVAIISDVNPLSISLLEKFINRNFKVVIIASEKEDWAKEIKKNYSKLTINNLSDEDLAHVDYAVLIGHDYKEIRLFDKIKYLEKISSVKNKRIIIVFPLIVSKEKFFGLEAASKLLLENSNFITSIFYLDNIFGKKKLMLSNYLKDKLKSIKVYNKVEISENDPDLRFISSRVAADGLIRNLLSFGLWEKKVIFSSGGVSPEYFLERIRRKVPGFEIYKNNKNSNYRQITVDENILVRVNLSAKIDKINKEIKKIIVKKTDSINQISQKSHQEDETKLNPTNSLAEIEPDSSNKDELKKINIDSSLLNQNVKNEIITAAPQRETRSPLRVDDNQRSIQLERQRESSSSFTPTILRVFLKTDIKKFLKFNLNKMRSYFKTSLTFNLRISNRLKYLSMATVFVLALPIILTTLSLLALMFGNLRLIEKNEVLATSSMLFTQKLSQFSQRLLSEENSNIYFYLDLDKLKSINFLTERVSRVRSKKYEIRKTLLLLSKNVFSDKEYSIGSMSDDIYLQADTLYKEIGFILPELNSLSPSFSKIISKTNFMQDLENDKDILLLTRTFSKNLNELLGGLQAKKYLVVLQDEEKLRPTGGKIEKLYAINFENGHFRGMETIDVERAEKEIKGYVEPPTPIKKYEREAWVLGDANWFTDFKNSADQVEWFLEKAINRRFDGVISINRTTVDLISQKTSADSDLDKIIENLPSLVSEKNQYNLGELLIESFEKRQLQIYLDNPEVANVLSDLSWDGGVNSMVCSQNCYSDIFGITEFNLGESSTGNISKRSVIKVNYDEEKITRELNLFIINGSDDIYKSYIRLIVPPDVDLVKLQENSRDLQGFNIQTEKRGNYKEIGFYIEVPKTSEKLITSSWTSDIKYEGEGGEYHFLLRKQPGVENDFYSIRIAILVDDNINFIPQASLTNLNVLEYNTLLSSDLPIKVWW